ncbi:MAG: hypothetical protein F6K09_29655, partial [Merismopedia sp. SIO2A8]|nr:hypothetical protein [Merismopedia sp. SIO2A8]
KTKKLVGFVRATGDGVFNATVWDLVVDPSLPNQDGLKMLLLARLKQEVKKTIPNCAISMLANAEDIEVLEKMDFDEDERGIRAMALVHDAP